MYKYLKYATLLEEQSLRAFPLNGGGWDDLNAAVEEEGISWGVIQWVFVLGLQGNQVATQSGSRGRRVSPREVQGAGPPFVPGSNCSALVIMESTRGERKSSAEIVQGPVEQHAVFDSPGLEYAQHPMLKTG